MERRYFFRRVLRKTGGPEQGMGQGYGDTLFQLPRQGGTFFR